MTKYSVKNELTHCQTNDVSLISVSSKRFFMEYQKKYYSIRRNFSQEKSFLINHLSI